MIVRQGQHERKEPTLHSGQLAAVNKLAYRFGKEPRRGGVVAVCALMGSR
jgi:hypothetical protein